MEQRLPAIAEILVAVGESADVVALLTTALFLGIRHGIDWDHIAAITDITSTTAAAEAGESAHEAEHHAGTHDHEHGGSSEIVTHLGSGAAAVAIPARTVAIAAPRSTFMTEQRRAIALGTLYALGHAAVVAVLGLAALLFGSLLPDWVDPIMTRVVGITLIVLGVWVFYSVYAY